jgi:hypothetical protein
MQLGQWRLRNGGDSAAWLAKGRRGVSFSPRIEPQKVAAGASNIDFYFTNVNSNIHVAKLRRIFSEVSSRVGCSPATSPPGGGVLLWMGPIPAAAVKITINYDRKVNLNPLSKLSTLPPNG